MKDVMLEFLIVYLHIYKKSVSYKETIKLADCPINLFYRWKLFLMEDGKREDLDGITTVTLVHVLS
jgi:hypothetical protein